MKNILLLPRYTGQCNISVFKLFTPIRPKIKHQATCLDLSQKSSSSNTPTSDYYLKHYHQPKCNQPGHKFVDEDQEKTSEQSTKLKIFGPWRLPLLFLALVVEYFWTWQKKSETAKKQCMLNLIYLQLYPDLSKPSVLRSSLLDAQVNNKQRRNNVF